MMVTLNESPRPTPRLSLRLKVTLYMAAVALIIQALLGAIVLYFRYAALDGLFDSRLSSSVEAVSVEVGKSAGPMTDERLAHLIRQSPPAEALDRVAATLYTDDGDVVASTVRPAPAFDMAPTGADSVRRTVRDVFGEQAAPARVAARKVEGDRVLVMVAEERSFDAAIAALFRVFVIASAVGIAAWSFAAWLIAGLALAPLRDLRAVAGSLSPESIDHDMEIGPSSSSEVAALENDLRESRSKLRSALHAQDRFIANVSHELNTPIAVLITEAQTLRSHDLPPEARGFVQSVTEEMQRLGRMVGSFLTLTKMRGGHGLTVASPCPINDVLMDTIQQAGSAAAQHGVTIVTQLPEEGPPPVVCGDSQLLRAMLDNLLRNAIRYSPRGSQVSVQVAPSGPECEIVVRDAGPGVPDYLIASLFDRFADAPRQTPSRRGQGIGLSVAQGVAELHGGQITVRNLPAGGCEFTVRLPLAQEPTPAQPDPCAV